MHLNNSHYYNVARRNPSLIYDPSLMLMHDTDTHTHIHIQVRKATKHSTSSSFHLHPCRRTLATCAFISVEVMLMLWYWCFMFIERRRVLCASPIISRAFEALRVCAVVLFWSPLLRAFSPIFLILSLTTGWPRLTFVWNVDTSCIFFSYPEFFLRFITKLMHDMESNVQKFLYLRHLMVNNLTRRLKPNHNSFLRCFLLLMIKNNYAKDK